MWKLLAVLVLVIGVVLAQRRNYSHMPCPHKCVCFRRTIRCMQADLVEVPKVPLAATFLDLRFNRIHTLEPHTFKNHKNIRTLLLNNNEITTLKNGVFTGMPQLKDLYLYKNRIKYIEPDVFQKLPRLEHLYLHNNDLEEFKAGTFSNLPSLDRLFLYNNKLKHIPRGAFQNLPKLHRLRLDSNALVCDCQMAWLAKMLNHNSLQAAANCEYPREMKGKALKGMDDKDFHCKYPEITGGPQDIDITFGQTALFQCYVAGDPMPSISWMKNDKELITGDNRFEVTYNGTLKIKNAQESDSGFYECIAKNPDGVTKSRAARMVVQREYVTERIPGMPVFIETPQSITVNERSSEAVLHCQAIGNPKPEITWSRNGIKLDINNRNFQFLDGTLVIRSVKNNDYGTYRCDAANIHGRISTTAEIIINVPPEFTLIPQPITVEIGKTARFECDAVGTPMPEISWYMKNTKIKSQGRHTLRDENRILEIRDVKESDGIMYTCRAKNEMGKRSADVHLSIKSADLKAPNLIYKPYNIEALVGSTIEIPCKGAGNPTPGIDWKKDGSTLQRTGRWRISLSGNLYIYSVASEDQGRYECTAINEYGSATASGYVSVKEDPHNLNLAGAGDKFVKVAFLEASQEVDKAINKTVHDIFYKKHHNFGDLFRIIRYPNAPARELARAAEVYERTLVNIKKHVEIGMQMNYTSDFNYKEVLSPEHLDLVAQLSGCMTHRRRTNCTDMCYHSKYRSIDGTCNNLQNPTWGASLTGFRRILKPIYENGFSTPIGWNKDMKYYGFKKPSSRLVSTSLISTNEITPDDKITHMVMQWGQFLDHDLDHAIPSVSSESWNGTDCKRSCDYSAPCFPIDVPPNDPRVHNRRCIDFFRSSAICGSGITSVFFDTIQHREQINQLTSYIDASQVYGYSNDLAKELRDLNSDLGKLREGVIYPGRKPMLPYHGGQMDCRRDETESNVNCFLAGDIRANEQVGLIAMHTIWFREHNRLARELRLLNPHWEGDMIYQEARKIVGAAMQHITYTNWLPIIVGNEGMRMLGEYKGYNPQINPGIANVFATAALRFGHSLINPILHRLNSTFQPIPEGNLMLHKAFFAPWRVLDEGGIDPLIRGLYAIAAKLKKPNQNLNKELTERLFQSAHAVALDLAAINIHRSRDHAIPGYIEFRKFCNMADVDDFEDLRNEISDPEVRRKLKELYGHPGNIDIWVGGILEDQVEGGKIGPLFRCLLVEQFGRLRNGDRFWYENPSTFKPEQLVQIKQYTLSRVLCDNGDNITDITDNAFYLPETQGGYKKCLEIPKVDMSFWSECCSDCRYSGQLNTISRLNARSRRETVVPYNNATMDIIPEPEKKDTGLKKRIAALEETVKKLERELHRLKKAIKRITENSDELML
ncbi:PREDICTED: peroxidasin [Nicrophorus vespilloides]|uniref:Peroxidasin n=1 Tax=Nicrophorus vespilloides TaxID=110193 RepID=A0ABM1MR40_NICVS|nr:PREDICTED: peroxidasin [Nicrophorus vespilloides]